MYACLSSLLPPVRTSNFESNRRADPAPSRMRHTTPYELPLNHNVASCHRQTASIWAPPLGLSRMVSGLTTIAGMRTKHTRCRVSRFRPPVVVKPWIHHDKRGGEPPTLVVKPWIHHDKRGGEPPTLVVKPWIHHDKRGRETSAGVVKLASADTRSAGSASDEGGVRSMGDHAAQELRVSDEIGPCLSCRRARTRRTTRTHPLLYGFFES